MESTDYVRWRTDLATVLSNNPNDIFSKRQPALASRILNSQFPDTTILKYYTHPVVSSIEKLTTFNPEWRKPDMSALAELCKALFAWDSRWGMCRFMRSITPGYLLWNMVHADKAATRSTSLHKNLVPPPTVSSKPHKVQQPKSSSEAPQRKLMTDYFNSTKNISRALQTVSSAKALGKESYGILEIHGSRKHFSTDEVEELRLSYIPSQMVSYTSLKFDLTRSRPALTSSHTSSPTKPTSLSPTKRPVSQSTICSDAEDVEYLEDSRDSKWSPDEIDKLWIPRVYVRYAYSQKLTEWEHALSLRKSPKKAKGKGVASKGVMDQFVRHQPLLRDDIDTGLKTFENDSLSKTPSPTKKRPVPVRKENVPRAASSQISRREDKAESLALTRDMKPQLELNLTKAVWISVLSDSDSDSESLPSPTSLLKSLLHDKSKASNFSNDLRTEKVNNRSSSSENLVGRSVGGFRESLGGTLHEVED
jgi:Holliday junction resolvase Gen1 C-terminal domain